MAEFGRALNLVLAHEGGCVLVDVEHDRGGQTYAGISRQANPDWPGWDLIDQGVSTGDRLRGLVADRYRSRYWTPIRGDELASDAMASALFSAAVLSGVTTAIRLSQMVIGVQADGVCGPVTIRRLNEVAADELAEAVFDARFALVRISRYLEITKRDPKQTKFLAGWVRRAIEDSR